MSHNKKAWPNTYISHQRSQRFNSSYVLVMDSSYTLWITVTLYTLERQNGT